MDQETTTMIVIIMRWNKLTQDRDTFYREHINDTCITSEVADPKHAGLLCYTHNLGVIVEYPREP